MALIGSYLSQVWSSKTSFNLKLIIQLVPLTILIP